jgi:hypothetical protein
MPRPNVPLGIRGTQADNPSGLIDSGNFDMMELISNLIGPGGAGEVAPDRSIADFNAKFDADTIKNQELLAQTQAVNDANAPVPAQSMLNDVGGRDDGFAPQSFDDVGGRDVGLNMTNPAPIVTEPIPAPIVTEPILETATQSPVDLLNAASFPGADTTNLTGFIPPDSRAFTRGERLTSELLARMFGLVPPEDPIRVGNLGGTLAATNRN